MRILAATDFSTRSQRAVRRAGILAREALAELLLLHVVNHARAGSTDVEIREAERMLAEQVTAIPELTGIPTRSTVTTGDPGDAILDTAVSQRVDMVVMGAPRRSLFRSVGRTVKRVINAAHTPCWSSIARRREVTREPWLRSICRTSRRRRCSRRSGSGSWTRRTSR